MIYTRIVLNNSYIQKTPFTGHIMTVKSVAASYFLPNKLTDEEQTNRNPLDSPLINSSSSFLSPL